MRQHTVGSGRPGVKETATVTVAFAGNPNSGKSTLINAIAGARLQVGNWPGVTVEKKEAMVAYAGYKMKLVDLPGTYSLSPYTQEEVIARDYLVHEVPDVIINVVDATNLERNFYLTVQLLELEIPVVVALNIYDEALQKGHEINLHALQARLGVRVVPTVATKKTGVDELLQAVLDTAANPAQPHPTPLLYADDLELAQRRVASWITVSGQPSTPQFPVRWLAFKLMEGDHLVRQAANLRDTGFVDEVVHDLEQAQGADIETIMADTRYAQAAGLTREILHKTETPTAEFTEKLDRIALHRFLGIPLFLSAMWLVFKLTFDVSTPFVNWMDALTAGPFTRWATALLGAIGAPDWTVSLATEGIMAGVGFVLVFLPVIFAMMFFITFLEGSGYMARAAFVMDRAMRSIGLHGKSFIPMLLGFGCNVPAIYATRTLENPREQILTALLIPLMSCGARLPVYVLFVGAFFAVHSGTILWSLYVLGITMAVLIGALLKHTLFKGESPLFIMELPPYRIPSCRSLMTHTWEKGKHFLCKAGTCILAVSVLVWFLLHLPWGVEHKQHSYLGKVGQIVAPVLTPLGFGNWEAASSLITGAVAKEVIVATMGEIYVGNQATHAATPTLAEDLRTIVTSFGSAVQQVGSNIFSTLGVASLSAAEPDQTTSLRTVVRHTFTPLSAYAFMVFVLLYTPCVVVAIALRQEFGTWKWSGIAIAYQMLLAWSTALIVYQGGRILGLGG
jgi:ferrous iron transport protein B